MLPFTNGGLEMGSEHAAIVAVIYVRARAHAPGEGGGESSLCRR